MTETTKPWTHRLWPLKWRPLLDVWIDVGLLQIQTSLWRDNLNFDGREYVIVDARLLRKWGFRFRLYDTAMRIMDR